MCFFLLLLLWSFLYLACWLSFYLFSPPLCPAGLCHLRQVPVAGIWASRTVQYPAPTLRRALPLVTYSRIPTNNHLAITNTNRYNKVREYVGCMFIGDRRFFLKYGFVLVCVCGWCTFTFRIKYILWGGDLLYWCDFSGFCFKPVNFSFALLNDNI